ncbi:hypothetical protein [Paraburkholderia nemoris]|jgi:ABC-type multidrug transport system permease subunit|uniref:hypothetical protein n=1 Tax=Paraburkholderia nemoris TaxID=2793076 RepID=UPI00190B5E44|nr:MULTISPECIES: hypothetical protein [Paraburkholderia]MBK3785475.1 hypothetical protein [Paraburkholderia aspalathi]
MAAAFTVNVSVRFVVMSAAFTVLVTIGVFARVVRAMRLMVMTAAFAMLVTVFTSTRFVVMSAAFALTMPIGIFIRMPMDMPVMPVGTGFGPFRAIRFGEVGVRHGWLPGSICGLVNTLKPLQGQGRIPEGP